MKKSEIIDYLTACEVDLKEYKREIKEKGFNHSHNKIVRLRRSIHDRLTMIERISIVKVNWEN